MASYGGQTTKNARRPTETQMMVLLDFIEKHPTMAVERGARDLRPLWVKLSRQLNAVPNGAVKSTSAWRKCWSDKKCNFRQTVDPNGPDPPKKEEDYTEIERRMVALGVLKKVKKGENGSMHLKDQDEDSASAVPVSADGEDEVAGPAYPRYRPTETQTSLLLDYMEQHPELVAARRTGLAALWDTVALALNNVPGGARKTPVAWMKYWADKKSNFRHAVFGTNPAIPTKTESSYSEIEKRMVTLGILSGFSDTQPQSTPENEDSEPTVESLEEFNNEEESAEPEHLTLKARLPMGRVNTPRATKEQQRMLLGYLERFPMLAESPRKFRPMWGRIAQRLNAVPGASRKTIDAWLKFWADKRQTLRKMVASGNERALSKLRSCDIERRMEALGVLNGIHYVVPPRRPPAALRRSPVASEQEDSMVVIKVEPNLEEDNLPNTNYRVVVKGEQGRTRFPSAAQRRALFALWRRRPPLSWLEVAARLNAMRPGCIRDPEQWRQYWSDTTARAGERRAAVKVEAGAGARRAKRERSDSGGDRDPISTAPAHDDGSGSDSEGEGVARAEAAEGGGESVYLCGELPAATEGAGGDSASHRANGLENGLDIGSVCWHQGGGGLAQRAGGGGGGGAAEAALTQCVRRIQEAHESWQRDALEVLRVQGEAAARATDAAEALADAARAQQAAAEALTEMANEQRRAASEQAEAILEVFRRLVPADGEHVIP